MLTIQKTWYNTKGMAKGRRIDGDYWSEWSVSVRRPTSNVELAACKVDHSTAVERRKHGGFLTTFQHELQDVETTRSDCRVTYIVCSCIGKLVHSP